MKAVCKECGKITVSKIQPRVRPRQGQVKDPAYLSWCSKQPCCISGELPATTHHVRNFGSPKDDHRVIRLAKRFHLYEAGPDSIERLGKTAFERKHGIGIEAEAVRLLERYLALYR
jgi:hypothetical protein